MKFKTNVKDIILQTYNVKSFRFAKPASFNYKAGQFMFITIKSEKRKMTKHFTISSSPTERDFIEFTKKLTGSKFSNALEALKLADWAEIDAPYGDFTFEGEYKKMGMLSGGIGITPLRSICKYCTDMRLETKISLLYSNHSERDIIFRKDFEEMQERNKSLKVIFTVSEPSENWNGQTGRINSEMIKREIPDYIERLFYTSGPPAMVDTMVNLLKDLGVPKKQIKKEEFPGY